jgi:hypothetical protein
MASTPSALGNIPGSPQSGPPPQPATGANPLLGSSPIPQAGPTPDQRLTAYMEQVRNVSMQIDALALDHPEASEDLNQAKTALTNSLSKVSAATAQQQSVPQPPTF